MTSELNNSELNKDAYLALSNGNYATLEEATDEFIGILSEDDENDVEAMQGVLVATLNFLRTQRKLDKWLRDNVPAPSGEVLDYSLEVAEQIGLKDNVTVSVNVVPDETVLYKELLSIIYPAKS